MVRPNRVDLERWLRWALAGAGITTLFWVTGLLASTLTALEVLSTGVHGLSLADYRATPVLALAPLSPGILVDASRDAAVASRPSPAPTPPGSPGPSPSSSGPTPSASATLPMPTPTLPIPTPTLPIPTPTPPIPTPTLPTPPPTPSLP